MLPVRVACNSDVVRVSARPQFDRLGMRPKARVTADAACIGHFPRLRREWGTGSTQQP